MQALALSNGAPISGQLVLWQSAAGIAAPGAAVLTGANGIASQTLTVGPLAEGQQASIQACLNGTSQCVAFTAFGARPEYAVLTPVSGTQQSLSVSSMPGQIALRLLDMNSNPMAGGTVSLLPGALRLVAALRTTYRLHARSIARGAVFDCNIGH